MKITNLLLLLLTVTIAPIVAQQSVTSGVYSFNIDPNYDSPAVYIKRYVTDSINTWQSKDMFETSAEYQTRVNPTTRKKKIDSLIDRAEKKYITDYQSNVQLSFALDEYDADNQTFLITSQQVGNFILPVPLANARGFNTQWSVDRKSVELYIDGDFVKLKRATFVSGTDKYSYDNSQQAAFARTEINTQFPDIEIATGGGSATQLAIQERSISVGSADVDLHIPTTTTVNDKTYVVIIANENYKQVERVPFANNDGKVFGEYCKKTLGIPEQNIRLVTDATLNDMRRTVSWLTQVQRAEGDDAHVVFYYAGHGIPNEATNEAYILPVDGYASDYESGMSLSSLYAQIGESPASTITYFIDACFSGSKRESGMLASARGVAIKAKLGALSGNAVAFSAATDSQTAYPYNEMGHGMFTYYLLKKLQDSKGAVSYSELGNYITEQVTKQSLLFNDKSQTPTVTSSPSLTTQWHTWSLK